MPAFLIIACIDFHVGNWRLQKGKQVRSLNLILEKLSFSILAAKTFVAVFSVLVINEEMSVLKDYFIEISSNLCFSVVPLS